MAASSTGFVNVYSGSPPARATTKSGVLPGTEDDLPADRIHEPHVLGWHPEAVHGYAAFGAIGGDLVDVRSRSKLS